MQILIVEDHLEILDCMRLYFSSKGHEVFTAATAEEAVAALSRLSPELALVDMLLPRGHGKQVLQEIRKRGLPTRMVVITASDDLQLRKEAQALGVSDYVFKPVTLRDLDALFAVT